MSHRATIHFENEAFTFLERYSGDNRSAYINGLILAEKRRMLQSALLKANQEEAGDAAYLQELSDWDETLADGLDA